MRSRLTLAELFVLAFFVYVPLAACGVHLPAREVGEIAALNAATFATLVALRRNCDRAPWLAAAADLFPGLLILVAYRESGLLLKPDPTHRLDHIFNQWDRAILGSSFVGAVLRAGGIWLQSYLELVYLLCYPLVLLGVAAINYGAPRTRARATASGTRPMDDFWAAVLLATLFCYAVYPFFPLMPPRVLFAEAPGPRAESLLRLWNYWLLNHYSVQACLFPSAHVAAVTAVALAVRNETPRLGALFLVLAASIAVATVYGRYHYAVDAVAGALVGVASYKASELLKLKRPKRKIYDHFSEP